MIAALVLMTGCTSTVSGGGTADPSNVASYQQSLAAAAVASTDAGGTACPLFTDAYTTWYNADMVWSTFSNTKWTWPQMDPYVDTFSAATAAFADSLAQINQTPNLPPDLSAAFSAMRATLQTLNAGLQADQSARKTGTAAQTWPQTNPVFDTLSLDRAHVQLACA